MTEAQVGILIGALDRWIRMRVTQRFKSSDGEWEEFEIKECMENVAAILLDKKIDELPASLHFTAPK